MDKREETHNGHSSDKDILYIANSASDPVQKFLNLVGTITSPVISGAAVYGTIK